MRNAERRAGCLPDPKPRRIYARALSSVTSQNEPRERQGPRALMLVVLAIILLSVATVFCGGCIPTSSAADSTTHDSPQKTAKYVLDFFYDRSGSTTTADRTDQFRGTYNDVLNRGYDTVCPWFRLYGFSNERPGGHLSIYFDRVPDSDNTDGTDKAVARLLKGRPSGRGTNFTLPLEILLNDCRKLKKPIVAVFDGDGAANDLSDLGPVVAKLAKEPNLRALYLFQVDPQFRGPLAQVLEPLGDKVTICGNDDTTDTIDHLTPPS